MADVKPVRLRLSRVWKIAVDFAVHSWRMSTPILVAGFGATFCCLAINEAHESAMRIGIGLGGALIAWSLSLAYEQGRANGVHTVGKLLAAMVVDERQVEIVVTHEHRASPEALAILREQELAQPTRGEPEGRGGGNASE